MGKSAKLSSNNNGLRGYGGRLVGALFQRNECEAKSLGASLEVLDRAIPILLFVHVLSYVYIGHTMAQHAIKQPG
jgi:hypothetical protein